MAAPNIASLTTITGKTATQVVTTTAAAIVSNSSASGKVFKVNTLIISNVDGTNSADITVVHRSGSTDRHLAKTITVPADATLVVISKETSIYLEEDCSIRLTGSASGDLQAICSYEEIS